MSCVVAHLMSIDVRADDCAAQIIGTFAQAHCFARAVAYLDSGKIRVKGLVSAFLVVHMPQCQGLTFAGFR